MDQLSHNVFRCKCVKHRFLEADDWLLAVDETECDLTDNSGLREEAELLSSSSCLGVWSFACSCLFCSLGEARDVGIGVSERRTTMPACAEVDSTVFVVAARQQSKYVLVMNVLRISDSRFAPFARIHAPDQWQEVRHVHVDIVISPHSKMTVDDWLT